MANISAKEQLVRTVLSKDYIYSIPLYQRPYSWEENQVMELYEDLYSFWKNHEDDEKNYFLGSIVLVKSSEDSKSSVIDGQQRLTSLSILYSVLFDKASIRFKSSINSYLWEEGDAISGIEASPRLNLRKADAPFFENYILRQRFNDLFALGSSSLETDAQNLIKGNTKVLYDNVARDFGDDSNNVDKFASFVAMRCYIVVVTTPDEETAYEVFSVLNNRGLSLLPSDIIKGDILSKIPVSKQQEYTEKWEAIENDVGRDNFNQLLSHIRMIFANTKLQGTLVKEFTKYVIDKCPDKKKLIDDVVIPYARVYMNILKQDGSYEMQTNAIREYFMWLNKIGDSYWIPPIMKGFVKYQSDYGFLLNYIKKFERLVAYLFLTNQSPNKKIDRYGKITIALDKGKQEALNHVELDSEEQNEFIDQLNGDIYLMSSQKRKYAVCRLDSFILAPELHKIYSTASFTIEHILPQNPKRGGEWFKTWTDGSIRSEWLNKISNLALLTRSTNSEVSNSDFKIKKDKYINGKYGANATALISQILSFDSWTPEIVKARQQSLMAVYMEKWDLHVTETEARKESAEKQAKAAEKAAQREKTRAFKIRMRKFFESKTGQKLLPLTEVTQRKPEKDFVTADRKTAYCLLPSKTYDENTYDFWYGYSMADSVALGRYDRAFVVYGSIDDEILVVLPYSKMENLKNILTTSPKEGPIVKWHVYLKKREDGGIDFIQSKVRGADKIDVTEYIVKME